MAERDSSEVASLDGVWRAGALPALLCSTVGPGLAGAVAGPTRVAWFDPAGGVVGYHGHALASLRGIEPDALAYLLLTGVRPDVEGSSDDVDDVDAAWTAARQVMIDAMRLSEVVIEWIALTEAREDSLKVLRAGLSIVGCTVEAEGQQQQQPSNNPAHMDRAAQLRVAMRVLGHVVGLVKVLSRRRMGHPLQREWEADMGLSERLLTETRAMPPTQEQITLFNDVVLALADGALTPGAFAGLVVASCEADWYAALVAALSGFEGELLQMRDEGSGDGDGAAPGPDARRDLLREVLAELEGQGGEGEAAQQQQQQLERATLAQLGCEALRRLNVADALIPCVYVFARSLGLVARLCEQASDNRIYRPLAQYTGPAPRSVPPQEARPERPTLG